MTENWYQELFDAAADKPTQERLLLRLRGLLLSMQIERSEQTKLAMRLSEILADA